MATLNKTVIARTIEVQADAINADTFKAFKATGDAQKRTGNAALSVKEAFINNNWDLRYTTSPCKNDGVTPNPDSKSKLTAEQYTAIVSAYASGRGLLTLFKTNPAWLASQKSKAAKGVKKAKELLAIQTEAMATAKTKAQKAAAQKAYDNAAQNLAKAEKTLSEYTEQGKERNKLVAACGTYMKDLRKSLSRHFHAEHKQALLDDGKTTEQAEQGAAMLVAQMQKEADVSVKYGGEKHLPVSDALPSAEEIEKARIAAIQSAITKLNGLPDSPEIQSTIKQLEALTKPSH